MQGRLFERDIYTEKFFTAADVARFDAYRAKLDDAIKSGDLTPAYAIFATYRKRVDERVAYARGLLKQPGNFDFTGKDRYAVGLLHGMELSNLRDGMLEAPEILEDLVEDLCEVLPSED